MIESGRTRIYTPQSRLRHPGTLVSEMFRDVCDSHELARRLAARDIAAQYRQTALGVFWVFLLPVANTLVWLFLRSGGVVDVGETPVPYVVYVFSGTILWTILSDAVNAPLAQATNARAMLVKVNFPREALILSGVYQTLFNALIRIAVLVPAVLALGVEAGWSLALLPVAILSLVIAGTAIGLLLTPPGLLYTDVGKSLPLLMQFMMYLSPVVFPMPGGGIAARIFELNPLTPLIVTARDWLVGMPAMHVAHFAAVTLAMLLMLLMVGLLYRLAMPILIERMGS
jgi:lipopolysaccharide transport system permease protein